MAEVSSLNVEDLLLSSDRDRNDDFTNTIPWYHGTISDEMTHNLLSSDKDGLFLVRDSIKHPGDFNLCLKAHGKFFEYRIKRYYNGRLTIDGSHCFDSLEELVEACKNRRKELCVHLTEYVVKSVRARHINPKEISIGYVKTSEFGRMLIGKFRKNKVVLRQINDRPWIEHLLAKSLSHENLVNMIGLSKLNQKYNLVTVYYKHETMLDLLRTWTKCGYVVQYAFNFCYDICLGMEYLEKKHAYHQFLGARNVYITNTGVAKLANFGLFEEYLETFKSFPLRHAAPEVLIAKKHSIEADMWSFGVLLWEIYSSGATPYHNLPCNKILKHLRKNKRLSKPTTCPGFVHEIMERCWRWKIEHRPKFHDLILTFSKLRIAMKNTEYFLNF